MTINRLLIDFYLFIFHNKNVNYYIFFMIGVRTKIMESATKLFINNHYTDIGIRDIAKATGINHSTVLYYFKNKEELFLGILKSIIQKVKNENKDWISLIINFEPEKYNKEQSFEYLNKIITILVNKVLLQDFKKYKKLMFKDFLRLESSKQVVYDEFEKPMCDGFIKIITNIIDIDREDMRLYILPSMIMGQILGMVNNVDLFLKMLNKKTIDDEIKKIIIDMVINQTKMILSMYDKNNKGNKDDN